MKKWLVSAAAAVLALAGCSLAEKEGGSVTFRIGSPPRAAATEDSVTISLKGDVEQSRTVQVSSGAVVTFEDIEVGKTVYAEAYLSRGAEKRLYTGRSGRLTILPGDNEAAISMKTPSSWTVRLDANGGSFPNGTTHELHTSGALAAAESLGLTRSGSAFLGWAESASADKAEWGDGAAFVPFADTTLYAVWRQTTTTTTTTSCTASSEDEFMAAAEKVESGGTIMLSDTITISSDFEIAKAITIDGQGLHHIEAQNVTLAFEGVTFTNCRNSGGFGGALSLVSCATTFKNCTFSNNVAYCAAVNIDGFGNEEMKTTSFTGCTFSGNTIEGTDNIGKYDINASGEKTRIYFGGGNTSDHGTGGIFLQPEVYNNTGAWEGSFE